MPTYFTPNRHGYAVKFSKFLPDRIVVASSQFFGLAGGGTLYILDVVDDENIKEVKTYQVCDAIML